MHPFFPLHTLAARRGDGLRPEFVRMFKARAAYLSPAIVQLRNRRSDDFEQAGPNPLGEVETWLPDDVLRFPAKDGVNSRRWRDGFDSNDGRKDPQDGKSGGLLPAEPGTRPK